NFLVHGPGPGGRYVDLLHDTLPVLPAAGPGRDELIQITAEGLTRFSAYDERPLDQAERFTRGWQAVDGTFPRPQAELTPEPLPELPAELPAEPAVDDPHSRLLDRMAEVCATRYPDAK